MLSKPLSAAVAYFSSGHQLQEMECFSGKVFEKSKKEFELKSETDGNGVEDFSVDDLFDFPETDDDDVAETEILASGGGLEEAEACVGVKLEDVPRDGAECGFSPTEISVPIADVAELEWLSRFVDDSFSEFSLEYSRVNHSDEKKLKLQTVTPAEGFGDLSFPRRLTKPRAKRRGTSGESWTRSSSLSDSTSSSSSTGSTLSPLTLKVSRPPPKKRQKREIHGGASQSTRRCSHCGVQKTPQWRAGPEGEKTLCNACGVRYKSGRLCPEYRPACSPTFTPELHSNQHRKVVELRRKKEAVLSL